MISSCHWKLLATSFQIQIRNQLCFFLSSSHNVLSICCPPSVAQKPIWCNCSLFLVQCHHKMATNAKCNKKTKPNEISQKLSTIQCLFLFKLFLGKCRIFTILVALKGSRLKRLRYGIHNHLRYKMNFLHVPLHVPWEMPRIVDLQFKVHPCWIGHVGTQKPKKDKSFRKSPYNFLNLLSPNICNIFFQHQVLHCHRSQNDFIMSLKIISDIFSDSDSQSAMFLPLKLSQCIVDLLSTLRCTKANITMCDTYKTTVPEKSATHKKFVHVFKSRFSLRL